jgi:hypothetical protein
VTIEIFEAQEHYTMEKSSEYRVVHSDSITLGSLLSEVALKVTNGYGCPHSTK